MLPTKSLLVYFLLGLLNLALGQQSFETQGSNYHAKVVIQRSSSQRNSKNQPGYGPPLSQPNRPYGYGPGSGYSNQPWRQGDRITKQEVIQNMAKALLGRRQTSREKEVERRQKNSKALEEYRMMQARLARMQRISQAKTALPPAQEPQTQAPPRNNQMQDAWRQGRPSRFRNRRIRKNARALKY